MILWLLQVYTSKHYSTSLCLLFKNKTSKYAIFKMGEIQLSHSLHYKTSFHHKCLLEWMESRVKCHLKISSQKKRKKMWVSSLVNFYDSSAHKQQRKLSEHHDHNSNSLETHCSAATQMEKPRRKLLGH